MHNATLIIEITDDVDFGFVVLTKTWILSNAVDVIRLDAMPPGYPVHHRVRVWWKNRNNSLADHEGDARRCQIRYDKRTTQHPLCVTTENQALTIDHSVTLCPIRSATFGFSVSSS